MEKILKNILKLVKCILLFFGGLVCLSILMTCFDKTSNSTNCYTKSKTEREEILTNLWGPEIAKVIVDDKNKYLYTSFTTIRGLYNVDESDWEALSLKTPAFIQLWEKVKANDEYWLNRLQNDYENSVSEFCKIRGLESIPPHKLINVQPKFIDLFYSNKKLVKAATATESGPYDILALMRSLFVQITEHNNVKAFELFENVFNSREVICNDIYKEQVERNEKLKKTRKGIENTPILGISSDLDIAIQNYADEVVLMSSLSIMDSDKYLTDIKKYGYACYAFLYKYGIVVEQDTPKSKTYLKFSSPYYIANKSGFLVGAKSTINEHLK